MTEPAFQVGITLATSVLYYLTSFCQHSRASSTGIKYCLKMGGQSYSFLETVLWTAIHSSYSVFYFLSLFEKVQFLQKIIYLSKVWTFLTSTFKELKKYFKNKRLKFTLTLSQMKNFWRNISGSIWFCRFSIDLLQLSQESHDPRIIGKAKKNVILY